MKTKMLIVGIVLAALLVTVSSVSATDPVVTTDKEDYAPEEIVKISGTSFRGTTIASITVTRPDGTVDKCGDCADCSANCSAALPGLVIGAFENYEYQLDGIDGTYIIDVYSSGRTDNYAQTTFTDRPTYTVKSYSDNTYANVKNNFDQGETVYGKGVKSGWLNYYLCLRYYNPNGGLEHTCTSTSKGKTITCDYPLPCNAQTGGPWKIKFYAEQWDTTPDTLRDTYSFNVDAVCPDVDLDGYDTCNPGEPCDDGKLADCDDNNAAVNPGATEVGNCNDGLDNDCDGNVDCADDDCANDPFCTGCSDIDGDGYDTCNPGDPGDDGKLADCDDNNAAVNPGATEVGNCNDGLDNDCDGNVDCADDDCANDPFCTGCPDIDGDGYDTCDPGDPGDDGQLADCDDNNAAINPGATEVGNCNDGLDNDCDGNVDCDDGDCADDPFCEGSGEIPEFGTIAIPAVAVLGLFLFFNYRKRKEE